ncbi:bifunctional 2-C-methyl-D-erythritol 4-phosphate cytidylyltransferase/2-C-methyl-D-erythritol 2,4-cyclodiphosphate synthase [Maricaulis sp.]|uniref:bifunctional 2-C-methyl-D-erythritol 4-phosphate cytidylyltransferase/2-C-methyl-D-erythritol 2,4-cyclodiphosphate synthase n=1 Tax=Maricaulis sp. TaxID=1486257 RepID=UPI001B0205A2|nr:bifunctional 2-C-methyl-D-erythritol 4-phosphate cytidylyltransferase/2-C-methyl-D-erythritol 2,4-cyclodiphosphate synthase [Maricaulis sp.]MBO6765759.1 bifunctional 2-C-methyl-D-erythritol 4-phosphate cytidylyltransferase/2-C-methyl-D-erythritol 2,4-cyclodiphosphate synthase [Maricaulis sp.]
MTIDAIIVAAGRGERAGGGIPKQFRSLAGRSVLARTLDALAGHAAIRRVIVVVNPQDTDHVEAVRRETAHSFTTVPGGATRTDSVRAGLAALAGDAPDAVMIHDAARPFLSAALIDRLAEALDRHDAVIPALPATDALMRVMTDGMIAEPVDRAVVRAAQTPQAFRFDTLSAAYARLGGGGLADDAAVILAAGGQVHTVEGDADNFKLTMPADFRRAEAMLMGETITVSGQGFDVHRLEPAETMWLCGVELREGLGLVGHSDADAGLHAVTDAVLGCAGAGDIGQHFPPSDPKWKGAASDAFLLHALELLGQAGGQVIHADVTLIAERPKIGPYREAMRTRLAQLLRLDPKRVNIKATTTEKLGFTGRGEGLAAQAIVTARLS